MRLTPELVARGLELFPPGTPGETPAGRTPATESDHERLTDEAIAGRDPENLWIFAYGSLIWNQGFDFVDRRTGSVNGWHRAFRLGYDKWFRGSVERPGLMLVLGPGGSCSGVLFKLPPDAARANLKRLMQREIRMMPNAFGPCWIKVVTGDGPMDAMTFAMNRASPLYVTGLAESETVRILATAAGSLGSMAEYLRSTVEQLEAHGLHDAKLWKLQDQVAAFLENA
jgi:cation transport protein ChaC